MTCVCLCKTWEWDLHYLALNPALYLQLVDSEQEDSSAIGIQSDEGGSGQCKCPCCSMNGSPSQLIDVKESKHTHIIARV